MAYSLIAHNITGSTDATAVTTSPGINTTSSDILFMARVAAQGFTETVSDSKSNSPWNSRTKYFTLATLEVNFYYIIPTSVGSSHTATMTHGGNTVFPALWFAGFSGAKQTSPYDTENGAGHAGTTTAQPGTITPSEGNCLVLTAVVHNTTTVPTVNAPFTPVLDTTVLVGGQHYGLSVAYEIQTTATARNPTWTGAGFFASTIASFKAAAGATTKPWYYYRNQNQIVGTL